MCVCGVAGWQTEGSTVPAQLTWKLVSIDFAQIEHPFIYNSFFSQNNQTGRVMTDRQAGVRQGISSNKKEKGH